MREKLTDEELLLVFSHLDVGDLSHCGATCRKWRRLAVEVLGGWRSEAEPRAAAVLVAALAKDRAIEAVVAHIRALRFRPNLGIITVSSSFSSKARDEIVTAIGRELPAELVLVGSSCRGAMGPLHGRAQDAPDSHVERETGSSISLQLQWLPQSSIHYFLLGDTGSHTLVDTEPAMRRTRRSHGAEARTGFFDAWMDSSSGGDYDSQNKHSSLLVFSSASDERTHERVLNFLYGWTFPVAGGIASGPGARIYLYCGARGGLLTAKEPVHTAFVCVCSPLISMRACTVCEEWGHSEAAQATAMRHFVRAEPCQKFLYRLHALGPPLATVHAGLIISCIGRGVRFHEGARDCEVRALDEALGPGHVPITGFFSGGEIGPSGGSGESGPHTYACVVALFGKKASQETDDEYTARISSHCGFANCACTDLSQAGPFDEDYMAYVVPQP